jgi:hypothetical protein
VTACVVEDEETLRLSPFDHAVAMPRLFAAPRRWHTRSMHTQPPLPPTPQSLPPRPSYFTVHTLYPFLLLSCFTSLVLNLGHGKAGLNDERGQLEARISVLDALVGRYKLAQESSRTAGNGLAGDELWTEEELEAMERELELVGLGRAKGKSVEEVDGESISWKEVFLGKKGKEWEEPVTKEEDTDWSAGEPHPVRSDVQKC